MEKQEKNVLRDIDNIVKSLSSDLSLGFKPTTYQDSTARSNRMYEMDKNSTLCCLGTS
jgi:phage regulator Rha-like protein